MLRAGQICISSESGVGGRLPHYAAVRVVTRMGGKPYPEGIKLGKEIERRYNTHVDLLAAAKLVTSQGLISPGVCPTEHLPRHKRKGCAWCGLLAAIAKAEPGA